MPYQPFYQYYSVPMVSSDWMWMRFRFCIVSLFSSIGLTRAAWVLGVSAECLAFRFIFARPTFPIVPSPPILVQVLNILSNYFCDRDDSENMPLRVQWIDKSSSAGGGLYPGDSGTQCSQCTSGAGWDGKSTRVPVHRQLNLLFGYCRVIQCFLGAMQRE